MLRVGGAPAGYYSTTAGSIGFQAGAQSKAMVLLFMTDEALNKFRNSSGWTVGADATVAVVNIGANGRIDTNTAQQPIVVAFSAMPTASSAYVLAVRMGGNGAFVAGLVTVSTLLGMASIPVWLAVLRAW